MEKKKNFLPWIRASLIWFVAVMLFLIAQEKEYFLFLTPESSEFLLKAKEFLYGFVVLF